jgi:hypothetical protein
MAKTPPVPPPESVPLPVVGEVRYSLPELLREIEVERRESSFAMETIEQVEIQKMFANRRHHARGKK